MSLNGFRKSQPPTLNGLSRSDGTNQVNSVQELTGNIHMASSDQSFFYETQGNNVVLQTPFTTIHGISNDILQTTKDIKTPHLYASNIDASSINIQSITSPSLDLYMLRSDVCYSMIRITSDQLDYTTNAKPGASEIAMHDSAWERLNITVTPNTVDSPNYHTSQDTYIRGIVLNRTTNTVWLSVVQDSAIQTTIQAYITRFKNRTPIFDIWFDNVYDSMNVRRSVKLIVDSYTTYNPVVYDVPEQIFHFLLHTEGTMHDFIQEFSQYGSTLDKTYCRLEAYVSDLELLPGDLGKVYLKNVDYKDRLETYYIGFHQTLPGQTPPATPVNFGRPIDLNVSAIPPTDMSIHTEVDVNGEIRSRRLVQWDTSVNTYIDPFTLKADLVHTHLIQDVSGLQTILDSKAATNAQLSNFSGNLPISRVTNLQSTLDTKIASGANISVFTNDSAFINVSFGSANYAKLSHTHSQYALTTSIPTTTSVLTNDSGFLNRSNCDASYQLIGNYMSRSNCDVSYQLIGNYMSRSNCDVSYQLIGNYMNRSNCDASYQLIGNYMNRSNCDASYQLIGNYMNRSNCDVSYQLIGNYMNRSNCDVSYQLIGNYMTRVQTDASYQLIGNYMNRTACDASYQLIGNYMNRSNCDASYQLIGNYMNRSNCDASYQLIGNYMSRSNCDASYQIIGTAANWSNITGTQSNVSMSGFGGYITASRISDLSSSTYITNKMVIGDNISSYQIQFRVATDLPGTGDGYIGRMWYNYGDGMLKLLDKANVVREIPFRETPHITNDELFLSTASDPTSPAVGQIWFNNVDNTLKLRDKNNNNRGVKLFDVVQAPLTTSNFNISVYKYAPTVGSDVTNFLEIDLDFNIPVETDTSIRYSIVYCNPNRRQKMIDLGIPYQESHWFKVLFTISCDRRTYYLPPIKAGVYTSVGEVIPTYYSAFDYHLLILMGSWMFDQYPGQPFPTSSECINNGVILLIRENQTNNYTTSQMAAWISANTYHRTLFNGYFSPAAATQLVSLHDLVTPSSPFYQESHNGVRMDGTPAITDTSAMSLPGGIPSAQVLYQTIVGQVIDGATGRRMTQVNVPVGDGVSILSVTTNESTTYLPILGSNPFLFNAFDRAYRAVYNDFFSLKGSFSIFLANPSTNCTFIPTSTTGGVMTYIYWCNMPQKSDVCGNTIAGLPRYYYCIDGTTPSARTTAAWFLDDGAWSLCNLVIPSIGFKVFTFNDAESVSISQFGIYPRELETIWGRIEPSPYLTFSPNPVQIFTYYGNAYSSLLFRLFQITYCYVKYGHVDITVTNTFMTKPSTDSGATTTNSLHTWWTTNIYNNAATYTLCLLPKVNIRSDGAPIFSGFRYDGLIFTNSNTTLTAFFTSTEHQKLLSQIY